MMDSFLKYIQFEKRYSKHTLTSYKNDLEQFSAYLSRDYQLNSPAEANYAIIRSWILSLMDDELSAKSVTRKIATLRSYYKFLLRTGAITRNPALKIIAPKIKKSLPVFVDSKN